MFKKMQLPALIILCFLTFKSNIAAQTVLGAASGKAIINNQLHEWSVGEMCAVATAVSPVLIVTQGFLQPQETPVSTDETALVFDDLKVIPNPTAAIATLTGRLPAGVGNITFQLLDVKGTVIETGASDTAADGPFERSFDLSSQSAGTYFLNLQNAGSVKTFSIIKL